MSEREERVEGIFATNCGLAKVRLVLADGKGSVNVTSRWMGDEPALDVTFRCRHNRLGSHSGSLVIEHAEDGATNEELVLPPSDGALVVEYVRVTRQIDDRAGSASMASSGGATKEFTVVLWLHRDAIFFDGTEPEHDPADSPETFHTTLRAIRWLTRPWKLG